MAEIWLYTLLSVAVVSAISLIGVFTFALNEERLERSLFYLISFSVGALLGDAFFHILPEILSGESALRNSSYVLAGILLFFGLERALFWHHSHTSHKEEVHGMVYLTTIGDALHNFLDGVVIAAAFLVSVPIGLATALAVVLHEIPQEMGQFAVLLHGGWTKRKALFYNFLSALTAVLGAVLVLAFSETFTEAPASLLALGAASFIYVAMADLIPELQKERDVRRSLLQTGCLLAGILIMAALLLIE